MRPHRATESDHERGQILPLAVGGMIAFLLIAGLVIDTGIAFRERRVSQNISDLAAMAGTRMIARHYLEPSVPVTSADVHDAIADSIRNNGCTAPCSWTANYVEPNGTGVTNDLGPVGDSGAIPDGAQGVRVVTNRHPRTYFMPVIGVNQIDVAAHAVAMTSQLGDPPPGILIPLAVFDADYQVGQSYLMKEGMTGPGNFGWLTWEGSPSNPVLTGSLCDPDNPPFTFPTWFTGSTGQSWSRGLRDCLDDYIANETVVYVPLWEQTNDSGGHNLQYEIIGVAAFVITGYDHSSKEITGTFVEFYAYPSVPAGFGQPPCSATTDPDCSQRTNFIGLVD